MQVAELQQMLTQAALAAQHMQASRDHAQMQVAEEQRRVAALQYEVQQAEGDAAASQSAAVQALHEAQMATSQVTAVEEHAVALRINCARAAGAAGVLDSATQLPALASR